ncbi:kinase-like protein [Epithele typhae]|uniref:kinase-like protein n=1 Tax=Epithele typhae TaxID=378194 RepID=UPI0020087540|nr:kinase-like protein [Epithele typhae]KAH9941311.1 kinase-like protein [Epithele typhae]
MFDDSGPPSPSNNPLALAPVDHEWQPILHVSNQTVARNARCPYCHRAFSPTHSRGFHPHDQDLDAEYEGDDIERASNRAANYFQLLEIANESSRPPSPTQDSSRRSSPQPNAFRAENMAEGYFKAFFQEVCRLGMGANGSVYLCQHVLDENPLGLFAVKKVAVGQSHSYLLNTLKEVRLLEKLHHPNIVTYHHAWLESSQFSSFGPRIPTLHILMQWAEGGSLDDLIDTRLGRRAPNLPHIRTTADGSTEQYTSPQPTSPIEQEASQPYSRNARIRAFRALQRAPPEERERLRHEMGLNDSGQAKSTVNLKPVHLLSAEEIHELFKDVVGGLAFLHERSILHLDLKPGNVLLTWDEGKLVPRAMLSDFGTHKTCNTGTLEYSAPESLPEPSTGRLLQVDSKADMWSLGMILHKLLFFRLPFRHTSDNDDPSRPKDGQEYSDELEAEILAYKGFKSSASHMNTFEPRRIPKAYLLLLETLLNVKPSGRPTSDRVLSVIQEGGLRPTSRPPRRNGQAPPGTLALARPSAALNPNRLRVSPDRTRRSRSPSRVPSADSRFEASSANVEEIQEHDGDSEAPTDEKDRLLPIPKGYAWTLPCIGSLRIPPALAAQAQAIHRWQRRARIPALGWRTLKSSILVAKVVSLTGPHLHPSTSVHPILAGAALMLAVVDTWFESMEATLAFGAAHLAVLALGQFTS